MLLKNYQELIAKLFYEHRNELVHQIMSSSAQKERLNLLKNVSKSISICVGIIILES